MEKVTYFRILFIELRKILFFNLESFPFLFKYLKRGRIDEGDLKTLNTVDNLKNKK